MIDHWKQVAGLEPDNSLRLGYAGLALVLAELTGFKSEWQKALEGWNVRQSQQVLEWQAEARVEGMFQARRDFLLRLLQLRFPVEIPADLKAAIEAMADPEELTRWFDAAATAPSLDAFRAAVRH
jgi:hypothetical protein